ncbi:MAG: 3D domain-containing protein [Pyrinomonadaceae bacterium]|nr:3D domain-containing protein [Pyrinomonadaceae bacterium]
MIKLAGGSVLGIMSLFGFLFYFQPTVEAVTLASDSPNNLQQLNNQLNSQDNQTIQTEQFQVQTPAADSTNKSQKSLEANAFRATAYCLKGRTAMGSGVRRGIVAADPRVLPLGSRIQITAGSYSGIYTVADTGGAVKGRILDIWMPSCVEAVRFGRKSVMVSRLGRRG